MLRRSLRVPYPGWGERALSIPGGLHKDTLTRDKTKREKRCLNGDPRTDASY